MSIFLLLVLFGIYIALATYVLAKNSRELASRLFAALVISAAFLTASGVVRLTTDELETATLFTALIVPTVALQSILLIWLILVVFTPRRAAQPLTFWLLLTPFLLAFAVLLIDAIARPGWVFVGVTRSLSGSYEAIYNSAPPRPALIAFVVSQVVLVVMTAAIGARHLRLRAQAWSICAGLVLTLVAGGIGRQNDFPVLSYFINLPLYLGFAWATLRYGLFRPSAQALEAAIESLPESVLILDAQDRIIFANHAARETLGSAETLFEEPFDAALARAELKAEGQGELLHSRRPGAAPRFFDITDSAVQNDRRAARTIVLRDITRAQQQADTLREQNESQRRLLELVATLETPVTTLAEGVALAPVVGHLDSQRGSALTSRLLQAIHAQRLRCCIIDISGVATIDTAVAQTLLQAIQALRLLGCDVAITGIAPTVAQTLTQLGVSFGSVLTTRSPQEALAWALERQSGRQA